MVKRVGLCFSCRKQHLGNNSVGLPLPGPCLPLLRGWCVLSIVAGKGMFFRLQVCPWLIHLGRRHVWVAWNVFRRS